jgi:1-pyrroline-4-hydroxy-2-carboxylate deaminase
MKQFTPWRGVFPAVTTQFNADESLNFGAMEQHYALQLAGGVHGLVVCGSLGEASTLSDAEKLQVAKVALDVAQNKVPVLANVSNSRTLDAERFAANAAELGVQGLMVMPSVLYAADAKEAKDHLRAVAKAAQLPIMVYNNPVSYKVDLTPDDFRDLADCEFIVAIKESTDNIRRITDLRNAVGHRYQLFMGVDDLSFEGLAVGADGLLAGLCIAFPKETVALYNLMQAGRWQEALKLYQWFMPLMHLDVSNKLVQNLKLVSTMVDVGSELVRRPRQPLSGKERERVVMIVQKALDTRPDLSLF